MLLTPGERRNVKFVFRPSHAYLNQDGSRLFKQMMEALSAAEPENTSIRAAGTLYLRHGSGEMVPWSMVAWIRRGQLIRVQTARLKDRVELIRTEGASWKETSKSAAPPELKTAVALLESALLPNQVQMMNARGASAVACDVDMPVARFRIEGPGGNSTVTLDAFSRPGQIERDIEPRGHTTFLYSGYSNVSGIVWPSIVDATVDGSPWG